MAEPGKGSAVRPPNDGDLWCDNSPQERRVQKGEFTLLEGDVRGDSMAMRDLRDAGNKVGFDVGSPVWLEGRGVSTDDVNRVGGFGSETNSDPMFDKFKHEENSMSDIDANKGSGSEAAESVSSSRISGSANGSGADADAEFERYPNSGADEQSGPMSMGKPGGPNHIDIGA